MTRFCVRCSGSTTPEAKGRALLFCLFLLILACGLTLAGESTSGAQGRQLSPPPSSWLLDEFMIDTVSRGAQLNPSVAFSGTNYLVVWQDYRNGESDIYGSRVDTLGNPLDPSGLAICAAPGRQHGPQVAFTGTSYIVVWMDDRLGSDIRCATLDTSGVIIDVLELTLPESTAWHGDPHVACSATNCLLVWTRRDYYDTTCLYANRLDLSGALLDPVPTEIAKVWWDELFHYDWSLGGPRIVCGGINYLLTYGISSGHYGVYDICGALVDTSGSLRNRFDVLRSDLGEQNAAAGFDGQNYISVWTSWNRLRDVYARRIDTTGTTLGLKFEVCVADSWQDNPCAAFNGTDYICAWDDSRAGASSDLYGARIDTVGVLLDSLGLELVNNTTYARGDPEIAAGPGDQMLLVYKGIAPAPYDTQRVFGAMWKTVGVQESRDAGPLGSRAVLCQNVPNPFATCTEIRFTVPVPGMVNLKICDRSGRLVRTLADQEMKAGQYSFFWDGRDRSGRRVSSGVYFSNLNAGNAVLTRKMVLVR
jgi:hypothetical protein